MLRTSLALLVALFIGVEAHVQLLYPPATLNLDFLDTFRTSGICGHEASGAERTEEWKLPMFDSKTVTEFEAGANVTVSWALHYAHQGGWLFELYNDDGELTSTWNRSDHWDCVSDSTQQSATLMMPETPCDGCILRLRRQALEWGSGYRFHSCAMVNVVKKPEDECYGCSGHGECVKGSCECYSSEDEGFWYGQYCQSQNECEDDEHCGEGGVCVDSGNITPPGKQCYCKEGWFGKETKPLKGSYITSRTCDKKSKMKLGDPEKWVDEYDFEYFSVPDGNFKMYYTLNIEKEEIEFAIRAKTENWAAFGFRPIATGNADGAVGSEVAEEGLVSGLDEDVESEGEEEETEGEEEEEKPKKEKSDSRRRSLKSQPRMPAFQEEADSLHRGLLQETEETDTESEGGSEAEETTTKSEEDYESEETDADAEEAPAKKKKGEEKETEAEGEETETEAEGEETETEAEEAPSKKKKGEEKETEAEGEGEETEAEGEGEETSGVCEDGKPTTVEYDEGLHDLTKAKPSKRGLKSVGMPSLQSEKREHRRLGRTLAEDEDAESEAEGDSEETDTDSEKAYEEKETASAKNKKDSEKAEKDTDSEKAEKDTDSEKAEKDTDSEKAEKDTDSEKAEKDADSEKAEKDADSEKAETEEDDEKIEIEYVPEYIGEGTECENAATTSDAHPMINQDIYIVYAKDGMFRIQDSFTPSRAKPLPDSFYGGDDGIIDAVGSEIDGYTNVKFKRKLSTVDATADYCILEEVDYLVIYAYGQPPKKYTHIPNSGLETGRASNKKFYGEDELKFHGGGIGTSYEGRGVMGVVNFFNEPRAAPADGSCEESTLEGYECMMEALNGDYILHWTADDEGVSFACVTTGTGWVALGWPETPGVMIGSEAVIGLRGDENSVSTYVLEAKNPRGIVENDSLFDIEDAEIEQDGDSTTLKFRRLFDKKFTGEGETDLVVAFQPASNEVEYHGATTRGGISVALS